MKIRTSFVSNSSSSSFLLIFDSVKNLDKFSGFNGYNILKNDVEKGISLSTDRLEAYVASRYFESLRNFSDTVIEKYFSDFHGYYNLGEYKNSFDRFLDRIDWLTGYSCESESKKEGVLLSDMLFMIETLIKKLGDELFSSTDDENDENQHCRPYDVPEYQEYMRLVDEIIKRNRDCFVKLFTERILSTNKKIVVLTYSDEGNIGSYMEHNFMPFVGEDPDGEIILDRFNNH